MKKKKSKTQQLVLISLLFLVLFNFPFLGLFNIPKMMGGLPLLYIYIFVLWILLIISTALTIRSKSE